MILTAHQPVYLPWLGLFHKIALADLFVSFNQVQYQVRDWNNRNRIKTQSGPLWLSVPVVHNNHLERKYAEIEIDNTQPWGRKHWKSLLVNYRKAPHFSRYADYFEDCYKREWKTLLELNESMLRWFLETLGIAVPVRSAGDFSFSGVKSGLVLDMCLQLGADLYVFGAQGRDYADLAAFEAAGVTPLFQDYRHPTYPQQFGVFEPHLSVVDLLFNCGDSSLDILMSGNLDRTTLLQEHAA
jgi:hypothetical protein